MRKDWLDDFVFWLRQGSSIARCPVCGQHHHTRPGPIRELGNGRCQRTHACHAASVPVAWQYRYYVETWHENDRWRTLQVTGPYVRQSPQGDYTP